MWSGWLQQALGYTLFFAWCCVATLPGFAAAAWVRIDDEGTGTPAEGAGAGGQPLRRRAG
jgi:hypothetical protein